ncbi:MAG: SoxR reducing system RseC family protein [Methylococcales bacterium]|jgi:sigma-E factor negative regulatory protein RseC|nr:SoxR reducing system RseC family protein [Methylococcales bacterium]MBT7444926.1 SoxR reducing system RseC family protein [Methylococcales bacterium]
MMTETAEVVEVRSDKVLVKVVKQSGCSGCQSKSCGVHSVSKLSHHRSVELLLNNSVDAKKGDHVLLGLDESDILKVSVLAYLVPIFCLFAFLILGHLLSFPSAYEPLFGIAGLVVGFVGLKKLNPGQLPVILSIK